MAIDSTLRGIRLRINQATDASEKPEVIFGLTDASDQSWTLARIVAGDEGSFGGRLALEVNAGNGAPQDGTIERMTIDSAGNVGIGGSLTVEGALQAGAIADVASEITALKDHGHSADKIGALSLSGGTVSGNLTVEGSLKVGAISDVANEITTLKGHTHLAHKVGALSLGGGTVNGDLNVKGAINVGKILVKGKPLSTSPWSRATGGINYKGGNVGISSTTPKERLDVNGRTKSGKLTIGPWPANQSHYVFFGTNSLDQAKAGNYALLQDASGADAGRTFLNSPVDIRLRIGNSDKMVVAKNGFVGIGTASPGARLHVYRPGSVSYENNAMKIQTRHGYMTFGSLNKHYFHMHTNRPKFYFNKPASAKGGFHTYSTREHKKDIHYLSAEEEDRALTSIRDLRLATFRYRDSELGDKIHTGIIAEEAPEAVLSQGGRSIDLYDYVSYGMTAVKALQRRLEKIEARMRELELSGDVVGPLAKEV